MILKEHRPTISELISKYTIQKRNQQHRSLLANGCNLRRMATPVCKWNSILQVDFVQKNLNKERVPYARIYSVCILIVDILAFSSPAFPSRVFLSRIQSPRKKV